MILVRTKSQMTILTEGHTESELYIHLSNDGSAVMSPGEGQMPMYLRPDDVATLKHFLLNFQPDSDSGN